MLINIPQTIEGSFHAPRTLQYLNNMYNIGGIAVPRENYKTQLSANDLSITDSKKAGQALFTNDKGTKLYAVFGGKVYKHDPALETSSQIGSVMVGTTSHFCNVAVGFGGAVLTTSSSRNYYLDTENDTLTQITDSDLQTNCRYCVYIDGRYVWPVAEKVYFSDVNDPFNIQSLSFFDAESRPDQNLNAAVIQNSLYIFGTESIERFQPTGNTGSPFGRVTNSVLAIGYVGGLIRLSDRVIFIGRRKGEGLKIYELSNGSLTIISNDAVNELLALAQSRIGEDIQDLSANIDFDEGVISDSFDSYGRQVVTFTFFSHYYPTSSFDMGGVSISGIFDQGIWKWSFISDSHDYGSDRSADNTILTKLPLSIDRPNDGILEDNRFTYRSHTLFKDKWFALGGTYVGWSASSGGIYIKGQNFDNDISNSTSSNSLTGATDEGFSTDQTIPRGMRLAVRKEYDQPLQIDNLEFAYARNGVNHVLNDVGTTSDTVSIQVSKSGTSEEWSGSQWVPDPAKTQIIGGKSDVGRLKFQVAGGIAQGENYLGVVFKDATDMPTVYEKVIANGS